MYLSKSYRKRHPVKAAVSDITWGVLAGLALSAAAVALAYPLASWACHFAPACTL